MKHFARELLKEVITVSITTFVQSAMQNYAERLTCKPDTKGKQNEDTEKGS